MKFHRTSGFRLRMIESENRNTLFRIMLGLEPVNERA